MRNRPIGLTYHRRKVGAGSPRPHGRAVIGVEFESEVAETVRRRATVNQTSLSEEVRTLVEWGLQSIKPAQALTATPVRRSNVR